MLILMYLGSMFNMEDITKGEEVKIMLKLRKLLP
jgi:hypothetical protein